MAKKDIRDRFREDICEAVDNKSSLDVKSSIDREILNILKDVNPIELAENWGYRNIAPLACQAGMKSYANKMFVHHKQATIEQLVIMIANHKNKELAYNRAVDMLMDDMEQKFIKDMDDETKLVVIDKAKMRELLEKKVNEELKKRKGA